MVDSTNPDFKKAIKKFDDKKYDEVEKLCDKMISKNPKDAEALALKGLNYYYLKKLDLAEQTLKEALKANFKSSIAWHFYADFNKAKGDFTKAMQSYNKAFNYSSNNFTVIRDLAHLQLYLRQYESFVESSRLAVDLKSGMLVNWISLAFGFALLKDYQSALSTLNSVETLGEESLKKNDIHEIRLFKAIIQSKDGKYEDAMKYLIYYKSSFIDKPLVYDMIIENAIKAKKYKVGLEYCKEALKLNPDNINLIINYFLMTISVDDFQPKTYNDLLNITESHKYLKQMTEILSVLKANYPKSKILSNLDLAFSQNEEFEKKFENYFIKQLEVTLPSFFINIKFLYKLQPHKIPIIQKILDKYLTNLEKNSKVSDDLNLPIHKSWLYFYAAQHYLFLCELETAVNYINLAIDITPTVVEFYMVLSKIFNHSYMRNHAIQVYDKARKLDVGDRYLNAKMAKMYLRKGEIEQSVQMMCRFVPPPLVEENIKFIEPLWYLNECGSAFLINKNIIKCHYCLKNIIKIFSGINKDQIDFYGYCLRKYMIKELYNTIVFLDGIANNKYLIEAIIKLDLIYNYLKVNKYNKDLEEKFKSEFEKMKTKEEYDIKEYEYKNIPGLLKDIENDFYEIFLKLQKITNKDEIHYLCVKYFLKKDKLLMALKSMKILSQNKNTFYFTESVKLIDLYLQVKRDNLKGKEIVVDLAKEYIQEENKKIEYKEETKLDNIRIKLYQKNSFYSPKENKEMVIECINGYEPKALRKMKGEELYNLIIFSALYTDENGLQDIRNRLNLKMRLFKVNKQEVMRHLTFYEGKEFDTKKLFKLIKNK